MTAVAEEREGSKCGEPHSRRNIASIEVGEVARTQQTITEDLVLRFAELSGDHNPLHTDEAFARGTRFQRPVAHGILLGALVSRLVGMDLPGPGALWVQQTFRWLSPVFIGDTLRIEIRVIQVSKGSNTVAIEVGAVNQMSKVVLEGQGVVTMADEREARRARPLSTSSVVITGASGDIGGATALAMAAAGARVTLLYGQDDEPASVVRGKIGARGGQCLTLKADLTRPEEVRAAVESAADRYGQAVDALVHCPGAAYAPAAFANTTWNSIQEQIDTHVRGSFESCQAVLPGMLANRCGVIVNVGSIYTWNVPPPLWTGFVLAKSALRSLTMALAAEFGPKGIRVNMISPGPVEAEGPGALPERSRKLLRMQTPLRGLATLEDAANMIVFLCSEQAQFITGADIPICGGMAM